VQGPIVFNEKQYVDYDIGVYDNASFHAFENTNTKQGMGRVSVYPLGANWRFDGLGLTAFYDYGWGNTTPDANQLPVPNPPAPQPPAFANRGGSSSLYRFAALIHYTTEQMGLALEYDQGKNAFSSSNLFSSSGPPEQFGFTSPGGKYALFNAMANGILNAGNAEEQGFDVFGHYHFPNTPFTVFGLTQWFQPNTNIKVDPLDFNRYVIGVAYQYNEFLRFALNAQNLSYYHSQLTFPAGEVLGVTEGSGAKTHAVAVPDAVPRDTNAIFLNMEFNY
jgi:predicted porin